MEWFPMEPYSIIFYDLKCALFTIIFNLFVDYFLELLNLLVLLDVNHTGHKNLFFFLLSCMVRSIFGIVFFNLKQFLRKGDTNALAEF